jgi:diguanylate cyclase (GGDEF)-like protein
MYKLLAIDDDAGILDLVQSFLEEDGYDVFTALGGEEGISQAQALKPDLIICDVEMPDLDGWHVLEAIRKHTQLQHTPFLFLTGLDDMKYLRQGMNLGADDYLTKPFNYKQLSQAVAVRLEKQKSFLARFEAELKVADQKLDRSLNYDSITNLPNRNRLSESFLESTQTHPALAVLVLAIDQFKDFSSSHPESLVNIVLKGVSDRLRSNFQAQNSLFYLQSNQYLCFLPTDPHSSNLIHKAQQVLAQLSDPFKIMGREIHITASIGLAIYPNHGNDLNQLLQKASSARLNAESKGGNQAQYTE